MTRANWEERDLNILKAALGGEVNYKRVKLSLLNVFGNKEQKNIWITDTGRTNKCYACGKNGHIRRMCLENKSKSKSYRECCKKDGHISEKNVGITTYNVFNVVNWDIRLSLERVKEKRTSSKGG